MEIHYFAAARAAAGTAVETVDRPAPGTTLGRLLGELADRHSGTTDSGLSLGEIFGRCTFLVDGANSPESTVLGDAARVDVLPPFAGG